MSDFHSRHDELTGDAATLQKLAKERLDTGNPEAGKLASEKQAQEWAKLDYIERQIVINQVLDYDNDGADSLPVPNLVIHNDRTVGLEFHANLWDFNYGPSYVEVIGEGGQVTVNSKEINFNPFKTDKLKTDFTMKEHKLSNEGH